MDSIIDLAIFTIAQDFIEEPNFSYGDIASAVIDDSNENHNDVMVARGKRSSVPNYYEDIINKYSDSEFFAFFRMTQKIKKKLK